MVQENIKTQIKAVVVSAGRFHSFYLSQALSLSNGLVTFFSGGMLKNDFNFINQKLVKFNFIINLADRAYVKFKVDTIISPSIWYVIRDNVFDFWVYLRLLISQTQPNLFIGWAHCSLYSLRLMKKRGALCIIESGSMHILEQEKILKKEYKSRGVFFHPICSLNRKKMLLEYQESDYISVPSQHVFDSFIKQGVEAKKLLLNSYGADLSKFFVKSPKAIGETMRFLFVGQVSFQKGIYYLLQAWKQADLPKGKAKLVLIGNIGEEVKKFIQPFIKDQSILFQGPVAFDRLPKSYTTSDVFLFPSLQEGQAMVLAEAMASGLCLIATENSGAKELIKNGYEGWIIPDANVNALTEKILWCYHNREKVRQMGLLAAQNIKHRSWSEYGKRAIEIYKKICAQ